MTKFAMYAMYIVKKLLASVRIIQLHALCSLIDLIIPLFNRICISALTVCPPHHIP